MSFSLQRIACRVSAICIAVLVGGVANSQGVEFLSQNWSEAQRQEFYTTSQGSRMMPYKWFMALEVAEGQDSFLKTRIPKLGYLPNKVSASNPDGLPVGFVKDVDTASGQHIGLNCAACHTNQVSVEGKVYQVDGGPTLADMWGLLDGLDKSLTATRDNAAKFDRFATKVLGGTPSRRAKRKLREELLDFTEYWSTFINDSRTHVAWGRARLDAFGMIFNRVTSIDLKIPSNSRKPDAPVSYPFLWGTSFENVVQWNGSAQNSNDVERLGRNVGEVLGVFAEATFERKIKTSRVRTSAKRRNQVKLENLLKKLWSPKYPGSIDSDNQAAGKILFANHCVECHTIVPHGEQDRKIDVAMTPISEVKTDPRMAVNAATGTVSLGDFRKVIGFRKRMPRGEVLQKLVRLALISPYRDISHSESRFESIFTDDRFDKGEIKAFLGELELDADEVASELVTAMMKKLENYYEDLEKADKWVKSGKKARDEGAPKALAYKGRPLDGIWATAPYLHNGSVPNLYELLLPADQRTKKFFVGSNVYDPVKGGFSIEEGPGTSEFDTSLLGNSNSGHDMYGVFDHEERLQLVEYMKSL